VKARTTRTDTDISLRECPVSGSAITWSVVNVRGMVRLAWKPDVVEVDGYDPGCLQRIGCALEGFLRSVLLYGPGDPTVVASLPPRLDQCHGVLPHQGLAADLGRDGRRVAAAVRKTAPQGVKCDLLEGTRRVPARCDAYRDGALRQ
jgi:hypothetical protein